MDFENLFSHKNLEMTSLSEQKENQIIQIVKVFEYYFCVNFDWLHNLLE
jgi:hypothetical protein